MIAGACTLGIRAGGILAGPKRATPTSSSCCWCQSAGRPTSTSSAAGRSTDTSTAVWSRCCVKRASTTPSQSGISSSTMPLSGAGPSIGTPASLNTCGARSFSCSQRDPRLDDLPAHRRHHLNAPLYTRYDLVCWCRLTVAAKPVCIGRLLGSPGAPHEPALPADHPQLTRPVERSLHRRNRHPRAGRQEGVGRVQAPVPSQGSGQSLEDVCVAWGQLIAYAVLSDHPAEPCQLVTAARVPGAISEE